MWRSSTHESNILLRSVLWPAIFEIQAILEKKGHWRTSKWSIYELVLSTSPKFQSVSLCDQSFSRYKAFREKCTEWSKWPWTLQGQMYPIYVLLVPPSLKFHSGSLYDQQFSRYEVFYRKSKKSEIHHLTSNSPNLIVKSTLYTVNTYSRGPNFGLFRSMAICFCATRLSKIRNAPIELRLTLNT